MNEFWYRLHLFVYRRPRAQFVEEMSSSKPRNGKLRQYRWHIYFSASVGTFFDHLSKFTRFVKLTPLSIYTMFCQIFLLSSNSELFNDELNK